MNTHTYIFFILFPVLILTDRLITGKIQLVERFKKFFYLLYLLVGVISTCFFYTSDYKSVFFLILLVLSLYYCIRNWKDLRNEKNGVNTVGS